MTTLAASAMVIHGKLRRKREAEALAAVNKSGDEGKAAETEEGKSEKKAKKGGGFWAKIGSYLFINVLFILIAWSPFKVFAVSVLLLGYICMYEVGKVSRWCREGRGFFASPHFYAVSTVIMLGTFAYNNHEISFKVLVLLGVLHTLVTSFAGDLQMLLNRSTLGALAVLYLPLCLSCHLYLKLVVPDGFLVLFYYLVVCATDSFGQIVGTIVGGKKLTPVLSPGKTVSGAIGGTIAAVIVALAIRVCLPTTPTIWVALAAVWISISAQIGDLVASSWKRFLGIKDFGANLGPHGGVIDRFDSMLLAASAFFLFTSIMPY